MVVGAAHAAGGAGDLNGQRGGHLATHVVKLVNRKVHPKAGAARATVQAGVQLSAQD